MPKGSVSRSHVEADQTARGESDGMGDIIAVVGAGAIGSSVGAALTRAGHDVTIIDQWPQHVEAMKRSGLRIVTTEDDVTTPVNALHLCELASVWPAFDIAFLCVKSYDTAWMAQLVEPYLKDDGVLVGIQNGMNDATNAAIVGVERTVGCVIELSAEMFDPGVVQRNTVTTGTWLAVGELDGSITPRIEKIGAILGNVGTCEITDNITGAKWTKLIGNSMTCPFSVVGVPNQAALELPGMAEFSAKVGMESFEVGTALGHRIEPVFGLSAESLAGGGEQAVVTMLRKLVGDVGGSARTHAAQDLLKGRRTEIDFMNGTVVREGERLGVPTPYNRATMAVARRVAAGELPTDVGNLEELQAAVG